jgi:nicotinic acetylcholine receptor alpha-3
MILLRESDREFRPPQRSWIFSVDVPDISGVRSSLPVGFDHLATSDNEVDLEVGLLECTIGVAPFGWWRRCPLLTVVVWVVVIVLATLIITLVIVIVIVVIITTIASVALVGVVVALVVVASVIAAVVAAIITSIPIVIARIGSTVSVISSIRLTVTILEAFTTIAVVIAVAPGLLGGRWYPHGLLGITMELALVVHDHIEVTFEEGGMS